MVDAPCSGEGMFRKDEQAAGEWSTEHVAMCGAPAGNFGAGGGYVEARRADGYSTCTFAPEEDEGTVLAFLKAHPEFAVERVNGFSGFEPGRPEWPGIREPGMDPWNLATFRYFPIFWRGKAIIWRFFAKGEAPRLQSQTPKAGKRLSGKKRVELLQAT